ncbi:DNA-binding response OmpR family regulator [Pedobacter sp. CAN_A7]|uniref:response regulator n=1 Tax=Pedobacter sp. CAN_A7 TaxID=2787722 RepID=UPI0018CB4D5B
MQIILKDMKKRILVIDDDPEMGEVFKEIFPSDNTQVFFYEQVDNIFDLVSKHQPQIILLDYNLRSQNGGTICKQIKSSKQYSDIPVILLSAFPRFIYNHNDIGFDGFLEKPFDVQELINIVEDKILNGSSK